MQTVRLYSVRHPLARPLESSSLHLSTNPIRPPVQHRRRVQSTIKVQAASDDTATGSGVKLDDLRSMYSQLAQKTQKIYRSEQAKASQLTEMKQELAKQNSLLTKAKGLCGKLLHRSKKNRTQLESKALHHDAVEQNNLNVNFTLQEVRQELEQSKRAAEYFKKQWYKSLEENEEEAYRKQKAKAAQRRLARELDGTKRKLKILARVL